MARIIITATFCWLRNITKGSATAGWRRRGPIWLLILMNTSYWRDTGHEPFHSRSCLCNKLVLAFHLRYRFTFLLCQWVGPRGRSHQRVYRLFSSMEKWVASRSRMHSRPYRKIRSGDDQKKFRKPAKARRKSPGVIRGIFIYSSLFPEAKSAATTSPPTKPTKKPMIQPIISITPKKGGRIAPPLFLNPLTLPPCRRTP